LRNSGDFCAAFEKFPAFPNDKNDDSVVVETAIEMDGDEPGLRRHEIRPLARHGERVLLCSSRHFDHGDLCDVSHPLLLPTDLGRFRMPNDGKSLGSGDL
jgi:hypothetical protein